MTIQLRMALNPTPLLQANMLHWNEAGSETQGSIYAFDDPLDACKRSMSIALPHLPWEVGSGGAE